MIRTALFVAASLLCVASVQSADTPKEAPVLAERLLHGEWVGGPCMGTLIFAANGTFERQHYSPGNNQVSGTWEVRWDSLPPTLVLAGKTSDDARFVDKTVEVKLIQLDDLTLEYKYATDSHPARYTRAEKTEDRELDALQGTWIPLQSEEGGKKVSGDLNFKQIIKDDKVTFQVNGETKAEGKVVLDPTQNPKHLTFQFTSGQTDLIIYVRAGGHIIYCGNRDGKTRPSEFISGIAKGGEYLMGWKIVK